MESVGEARAVPRLKCVGLITKMAIAVVWLGDNACIVAKTRAQPAKEKDRQDQIKNNDMRYEEWSIYGCEYVASPGGSG